MKISHESPLSLLKLSRTYNDYDYALVHLFEQEPSYLKFFKDSLKAGREVILDNSIFELGKAFESSKFAHWISELKPTEYIIPDVLEDSSGTMRNAETWMRDYSDLPGKKIGVVQGKTYEEIVNCYNFLDNQINVDKIAISFDYSYYLKLSEHPNKWMGYTCGRIQLLSRLVKDGVINTGKPHHLLGCSIPIEFLFYRDKAFNWIESLDTSNPVVHGLLNISYEYGGLIDKQSIKLVDLIHARPSNDQTSLIVNNVQLFRSYVTGAL